MITIKARVTVCANGHDVTIEREYDNAESLNRDVISALRVLLPPIEVHS